MIWIWKTHFEFGVFPVDYAGGVAQIAPYLTFAVSNSFDDILLYT
jgi:hypothetical protein